VAGDVLTLTPPLNVSEPLLSAFVPELVDALATTRGARHSSPARAKRTPAVASMR
jgi:hypothetical protein